MSGRGKGSSSAYRDDESGELSVYGIVVFVFGKKQKVQNEEEKWKPI